MTKGMQGCIGLKFHLDTFEVSKHDQGESYPIRELMASNNLWLTLHACMQHSPNNYLFQPILFSLVY